jgi:hypothetical protein
MEPDKERVKRIANAVHDELDSDTDLNELYEIMRMATDEIRRRMERELKEALEQDRWETRYWHDRDYGGRL